MYKKEFFQISLFKINLVSQGCVLCLLGGNILLPPETIRQGSRILHQGAGTGFHDGRCGINEEGIGCHWELGKGIMMK
jgi:hypothetical protein